MTEVVDLRNQFPTRLLQTGSWKEAGTHIESAYKRDPNLSKITSEDLRNIIRHMSVDTSDILKGVFPPILLCVELCESYEERKKNLSEIINDMRFIVERYVTLLLTLDSIEKEIGTHNDFRKKMRNDPKEIIKISEIVHQRLLHTTVDWHLMYLGPFDQLERQNTKIQYEEPSKGDLITQRSFRVKKRLGSLVKEAADLHPGIHRFYYFCGEFSHPGLADGIACSLSYKIKTSSDGAPLVIRRLQPQFPGALLNNKGSDANLIIMTHFLSFSIDMLGKLNDTARQLLEYCSIAANQNKISIHKLVTKKYRGVFERSDLCPCASGKTVQDCAYSRRI